MDFSLVIWLGEKKKKPTTALVLKSILLQNCFDESSKHYWFGNCVCVYEKIRLEKKISHPFFSRLRN